MCIHLCKKERSKLCNEAPSLEGAILGHPPVKRVSIRMRLVARKPPLPQQGHATISVSHRVAPPFLYTKRLEKDVAY